MASKGSFDGTDLGSGWVGVDDWRLDNDKNGVNGWTWCRVESRGQAGVVLGMGW